MSIPLSCNTPTLEASQRPNYKIVFSHGKRYGLGYHIAIFVFSSVMGLAFTASLWLGLLFKSLDGIRGSLFRLWLYSVLWFEYIGKMGMAEPETEVVSWYGLKGGEHCLRYSTREYTARLIGGPSTDILGQDGMTKLCRETPSVIHGQTLYTDFCQDLGFGRGVWGYWIVDFEENDCETKWGDFIDLGCGYMNSTENSDKEEHLRRVESHLENLQTGSSWQIMCATTPADIDGRHFGGPDRCHSSPGIGTYGVWDLTDSSCDADNSKT